MSVLVWLDHKHEGDGWLCSRSWVEAGRDGRYWWVCVYRPGGAEAVPMRAIPSQERLR